MSKNPGSKGSAWEREACKFFSKWINGTPKPYVFWRGHGSGAMFTMDSKVGGEFSGDIYAVRPEGQFLTSVFSLELKNGYDGASIDLFLKNNKSDDLKAFWTQAVRDAEKSNKTPMLVFKKKNMPVVWLCLTGATFEKAESLVTDLRYIKLAWRELPDMNIISFYDFFERVNVNKFKELYCS